MSVVSDNMSVVSDSFDPGSARAGIVVRTLAWLLVAAALGGTFWLYTRPNLMLDIGSLLQMCGFPQ